MFSKCEQYMLHSPFPFPPLKSYTCAKKKQRRGWLIANNPIFWSSKAVVGLSDNFGWSITINTNKIKCIGGRRGCGQASLWTVPVISSPSQLAYCPLVLSAGREGAVSPLASLWSDYPFISSLSEEYLWGQWQIKAHMERSVNVCL